MLAVIAVVVVLVLVVPVVMVAVLVVLVVMTVLDVLVIMGAALLGVLVVLAMIAVLIIPVLVVTGSSCLVIMTITAMKVPTATNTNNVFPIIMNFPYFTNQPAVASLPSSSQERAGPAILTALQMGIATTVALARAGVICA